ncbi:cysteine hydrolase [[Clostridium] spiroforme]|nr:cysteine hydrolase [Thomasclavelia spiroformis]MBM6879819.1 cysteine hydrolase [Thomasclavelia spiroformis]
MKKLLIVVDYQKDFVDGSLGFEKAKLLDNHISSLIEEYHDHNDEVIFTFDTHFENYLSTQEGQNLPIVHCIENSEGWQLYGKASTQKQKQDQCFNKNTFGSLELGNYLQNRSYESITLVGVVSHICVISNAIICKAALPEVQIFIDTQGIAGSDPDLHQKSLDILENLQCYLI